VCGKKRGKKRKGGLLIFFVREKGEVSSKLLHGKMSGWKARKGGSIYEGGGRGDSGDGNSFKHDYCKKGKKENLFFFFA